MHDFREDEIVGKAYDSRLMKRLLKYVKPYWKQVAISVILVLILAVLNPLRPYITKFAIDDYILKSNYSGLTKLAVLLFGILLYIKIYIFQNIIFGVWIPEPYIFKLNLTLYLFN